MTAVLGGIVTMGLLASIAGAPAAASLGRVPLASITSSYSGHRFSPTYMAHATMTVLTSAQAVTAAQNFDLVVAHGSQFTPYLALMRTANPNLRIYSYVNGLYTDPIDSYPSSAYAYDTSGQKIHTLQSTWWLMDPTSSVWQSAVVSQCQQLNLYYGYDGCFLDNLGEGPFVPGYGTTPPVNVATNQVWVESDWMAATSQLAKTVAAAVPGWPVSVNGLGSGTGYFNSLAPTKPLVSAANAAMAESFLRGPTTAMTSFPSESKWLTNVQMLSDAEATGGSVLATTKAWLTATQAQLAQWHTYALASFLLGSSGRSYFNFSASQDYAGLTATSGQDQVSLGTPMAPFAMVAGVYQRAFAGGLVMVNPTKVAVTVGLPFAYKNANGVSVTSVTLAVNTAVILTTN
jgi:Hypothetical glycosyl hydrolase family 15